MRATWRFEGHNAKGREFWRDHQWEKVRVVNNSGLAPVQDRWYTVEYMTVQVDGGPQRVVLNAAWEA